MKLVCASAHYWWAAVFQTTFRRFEVKGVTAICRRRCHSDSFEQITAFSQGRGCLFVCWQGHFNSLKFDKTCGHFVLSFVCVCVFESVLNLPCSAISILFVKMPWLRLLWGLSLHSVKTEALALTADSSYLRLYMSVCVIFLMFAFLRWCARLILMTLCLSMLAPLPICSQPHDTTR